MTSPYLNNPPRELADVVGERDKLIAERDRLRAALEESLSAIKEHRAGGSKIGQSYVRMIEDALKDTAP